ncbi:hypothetical protein ES703_82225 [subsurface metagenome]
MSKRMKVLVSVLVAVLMLVGSGSAIAMAQEEEEPAPLVEANGLLARVAEILGIPEEDLIDAFGQARQEMREDVFYEALDKAVAEGIITEEEAEEIAEWWEQKPDVLDQGLFGNAFGSMGSCADCVPGNRLGVRAQIGSGLCQDGQQPLQQMRQRAFRGARGAWQQMGSPWLAE